MRVSTQQFYYQNGLTMSDQTSIVNEQSAYISSGKRVLTAKDDAVSYGALSGYKEDLASIERYNRNITQAESRNTLQDTLLGSSTDVLNEMRDLMLQANNGARSDDDLASISQQLQHGLEELLNIANSQDETGTYMFAGYDVENAPFSLQADNSVTYNGDNGVRELQIAKNISVAINQSGEQLFNNIDNPIGDFSVNYDANVTNPVNSANTSGVSVLSANIIDRSAYNGEVSNPQDYRFVFSGSGPDADTLTVKDSADNDIYTVTPYVAGQKIAFQGIEVQLNGNPLPEETFSITPESKIGLFDTLKDAIDWLDSGISGTETEQRQVDFDTILNKFNDVLDHITFQRAEAGINLQQIDRQKNVHLDTELYLEQGKAGIEDLDFSQAISGFEQSQLALQAAQQTFTQIQGLNLFNYI